MSAITGLFSQFGVTWGQLAGQLLNFIILLVLLRLFLYRPVLSMLEERKRRIAQGLQDAETAARSKAESEREATAAIRAAHAKAEELLAQTQQAAAALKQEMAAAAQAELAKAKQAHEAELAQLKQEMLREVRQELAQLVVMTVRKVLPKQLSDEDQQRFLQAASKELQ